MFSSRLRQSFGRNRLATALDARRAAGMPIIDLTLSNPTRAGFDYPPDLLTALARSDALEYHPEPFGLIAAREAVSRDLLRRDQTASPDRIVLTSSTSEAYSLLLKLLCDPGDVILAPRPSYPLLEHLADLEAVRLEHYRLEYHGQWSVDVEGIRERLAATSGPRVRAVIVISPNNPTGSVVTAGELDALGEIASAHEVAIIADEVFADYAFSSDTSPGVLSHTHTLVFSLGGLSKSAALPQMKLGWLVAGGPGGPVSAALERLEIMCDVYLSVGTPVQAAAGAFLEAGHVMREQIRRRTRENLAVLRLAAAAHPTCTVLPVEAGWYAVVQVPAVRSEEVIVLELLQHTGVLVHPGYFFDFEREAFLVLSLLPPPDVFSPAAVALLHHAGGHR